MKEIYVTVVFLYGFLKKCRNAGFDCNTIIREPTEDKIITHAAAEYKEHNMKPEDILQNSKEKSLLLYKNPLYR